MSEIAIRCPECGQASQDTEWCEHCGASLVASGEEEETVWLAPGAKVHFVRDEKPIELVIEEVVENFSTRKVFTAKADAAGPLFFVEETEDDGRDPGEIPSEVASVFRKPLARLRRGEHVVEIYGDVGGMTVEDIVVMNNGQMPYTQIRDIFEVVSETVMECHNAGQMVLAIAPWTVRVEGLQVESQHQDELVASLEDIEEPASDSILEALSDSLNEDEASLSAWDILEDEGPAAVDALSDTGILSAGLFTPEEPVELVCTFEGLDRTYPIGKNPDEVPVIMGFSAPELLGRVRADVTEATDVFGLGMLLYFMVAGRVPPASVYTRYSPALPARNFRPGFPPGLQAVISRATRPNPDERFQTVEAMAEAFLQACAIVERRASHVGSENPPRFRLAVDTHIGIAKGRRNPTNQDAVFGKMSDDGRFGLVVIADGVSTASYGSGDLASACVSRRAAETWEEILPAYLMDERIDEIEIISTLLSRANADIVEYVNGHHTPFAGNPHEVMGTTALVAVIHRGIVTLASLGDSRAYIHNATGMEQVTADHNLWSLSILEGVPADNALAMPHGDALARCLGTFSISEGVLNAVKPEADLFRFSTTRGDTLLLTTDGLIDFAGANSFAAEDNIHAVLSSEPDPALACLELVLLANRGGGGDNIGVGIVQFF
ncbi:MAG: protein phosphatase 2C domain-containing protein [bacterium]